MPAGLRRPGWSSVADEAVKAITASGNRIQQAANTIIDTLEYLVAA